jgi:hypothetical protein
MPPRSLSARHGYSLGGRVGIFTAEYRQYQEIYDKLEEILLPLKKALAGRKSACC